MKMALASKFKCNTTMTQGVLHGYLESVLIVPIVVLVNRISWVFPSREISNFPPHLLARNGPVIHCTCFVWPSYCYRPSPVAVPPISSASARVTLACLQRQAKSQRQAQCLQSVASMARRSSGVISGMTPNQAWKAGRA